MYTTQVQCSEIRPDPRSGGYRPHEVEALADSIRRHGVLRPVLLRADDDGYVIVHGERRWRASQMVGLTEVPAIIVQDVTREVSAAAAPGLRGGFAAIGRAREPATFDD
jgi:ParB family chromosome partitioning protein